MDEIDEDQDQEEEEESEEEAECESASLSQLCVGRTVDAHANCMRPTMEG